LKKNAEIHDLSFELDIPNLFDVDKKRENKHMVMAELCMHKAVFPAYKLENTREMIQTRWDNMQARYTSSGPNNSTERSDEDRLETLEDMLWAYVEEDANATRTAIGERRADLNNRNAGCSQRCQLLEKELKEEIFCDQLRKCWLSKFYEDRYASWNPCKPLVDDSLTSKYTKWCKDTKTHLKNLLDSQVRNTLNYVVILFCSLCIKLAHHHKIKVELHKLYAEIEQSNVEINKIECRYVAPSALVPDDKELFKPGQSFSRRIYKKYRQILHFLLLIGLFIWIASGSFIFSIVFLPCSILVAMEWWFLVKMATHAHDFLLSNQQPSTTNKALKKVLGFFIDMTFWLKQQNSNLAKAWTRAHELLPSHDENTEESDSFFHIMTKALKKLLKKVIVFFIAMPLWLRGIGQKVIRHDPYLQYIEDSFNFVVFTTTLSPMVVYGVFLAVQVYSAIHHHRPLAGTSFPRTFKAGGGGGGDGGRGGGGQMEIETAPLTKCRARGAYQRNLRLPLWDLPGKKTGSAFL
jgi:hypothetical protein